MTRSPLIDRLHPDLDDPDAFAFIVQCCERLARQGVPITQESLAGELGARYTARLTPSQLSTMLSSDRLARALQARGIEFAPLDALSAHQLHALAIYMDTSVPMTHRERLRNAKVTQAQWDGWMRQPRFAAYLSELSEERLATSIPLTHLRLLEAVDRGERWAIELHYQITGRHDSRSNETDHTALYAGIFKILDDAGIDGRTLAQIGAAMRELTAPGSAPARAAAVILAPTAAPAPATPRTEPPYLSLEE